MSIDIAIAALLLAALVAQDTTAGPQFLISEPIVVSTLFGWLFGDVGTGLLIGITTQLIWSGAVPAGSARFIDVNVATASSITVVALAGDTDCAVEISLLWMLPVGLLGSYLTDVNRRLNGRIVQSVRRDAVSVTLRHGSGWLLSGVRGMVTYGLGVLVGALLVPPLADLVGDVLPRDLFWAALLGAGGGTAVVATWQYSRGKAAALGGLAAVGLWLAGLLPEGGVQP